MEEKKSKKKYLRVIYDFPPGVELLEVQQQYGWTIVGMLPGLDRRYYIYFEKEIEDPSNEPPSPY